MIRIKKLTQKDRRNEASPPPIYNVLKMLAVVKVTINRLIVVGCLGFFSGATANDLVIESNSFNVDYNLNGAVISGPGRTIYNRENQDTLFAETELIVTWSCDAAPLSTTCQPKPAIVEIIFQAVAFSVNVLG